MVGSWKSLCILCACRATLVLYSCALSTRARARHAGRMTASSKARISRRRGGNEARALKTWNEYGSCPSMVSGHLFRTASHSGFRRKHSFLCMRLVTIFRCQYWDRHYDCNDSLLIHNEKQRLIIRSLLETATDPTLQSEPILLQRERCRLF